MSSPRGLLSWPSSERPRERLRAAGPRSLSARELLTLLVGSGSRDAAADELADRMLDRAGGSLRRLGALDPAALEAVEGVGPATAARIVAALELGRRAESERPPVLRPIRGPSDVHRFMGPRLRDLAWEEFHVLLLNTQNRVIREILVSRGILDASLVHPREVFRAAILEGAASIILVHNHPSGDPAPSPEDREVTRRILEAGAAVGIPVLDHVVVATGGYTSLIGESPAR